MSLLGKTFYYGRLNQASFVRSLPFRIIPPALHSRIPPFTIDRRCTLADYALALAHMETIQ